jgi:hypothetical protein
MMNLQSYPMSNIVSPGEHDVLCGRGGHTIHWSGNIKFRALVEKHRERYHAASRVEKGKVVAEVVQMWRKMTPPGRFLTLSDPKMGDASPWEDIGDKAAQKKTAKRLRESLPETSSSSSSTGSSRPSSVTFSTNSGTSDDDDSTVVVPKKKRTLRRVSNDSMEKAAKRIRLETEFQQPVVPSLSSLLFEDHVSDDFNEQPNSLLADEEELDLEGLFDDDNEEMIEPIPTNFEPISINNLEEVTSSMDKFHESWLSTSTPSAMTNMGSSCFGTGGVQTSPLLQEIAFAIPSAACLTEAILFD